MDLKHAVGTVLNRGLVLFIDMLKRVHRVQVHEILGEIKNSGILYILCMLAIVVILLLKKNR